VTPHLKIEVDSRCFKEGTTVVQKAFFYHGNYSEFCYRSGIGSFSCLREGPIVSAAIYDFMISSSDNIAIVYLF